MSGPSAVPEPFRVPAALDGVRVDRAVSFVTGFSRADVQSLVEAGVVRVDGHAVAKSRRNGPHRRHEVGEKTDGVVLPGVQG